MVRLGGQARGAIRARQKITAPKKASMGINGHIVVENKPLSKYEWIPPIVLALLILVHFFVAKPDGSLAKLTLFISVGLIPGTLVRLLGKPSWGTHRVCFALSLVAFVLHNPKLRPDADTLRKMLANWHYVTLGFLIAFTQPIWGGLRAHRLLADSGVAISQMQTLKLTLVGNFFNIFLPGSTGGDAYRIFAIVKKFHGKLGSAVASITLDRFLGLPSLILVVCCGMILDYDFFRSNRILTNLVPFIAGAAVVCLLFIGYLILAGKSGRSTEDAGAADDSRRSWPARLHAMVAANVKSHATLPLCLMYGFFAHLATIGACLCFGAALGVEGVPGLRYFLIVPMAMTINAIPGAPGGVGQGELAMATLLDIAHPDAGNAQVGVMVMLLFRLANMALGLVGGALYASGKTNGDQSEFSPAMAGDFERNASHGD